MSSLSNRRILLGVTGGIAAYKSPDIVRKLRQAGADVRVVMTQSAKQFITSLTLQAVSGYPVYDDLFDQAAEAAMGHIALARWADLVLIAPATADVIAKLAEGRADDLLTTVCLATAAPLVIAPAMNQQMWKSEGNLTNIKIIQQRQVTIIGPAEGVQACGDVGLGRMSEPEEIVKATETLFVNGILANLNVLITAGPTQEPIDPVRYLTNHSSGKMGYAIAQGAIDAGAKVTLVTGPVKLTAVEQTNIIKVMTAEDMFNVVMAELPKADIFIGVAAVCDYQVKQLAKQKIKKTNESMVLELVPTPDILKSVANSKQRPEVVVGFAAETENLLNNARKKLVEKNLDLIVANNVSQLNIGFDSDENEVLVLTSKEQEQWPVMGKQQLANKLIKIIARLFNEKKHTN